MYIFENSEAIGVWGSGTHVCLTRGFLGTSEFAYAHTTPAESRPLSLTRTRLCRLPKGKVQLWQNVQWPDRNRGFLSSLLGGDQRKAMKELFLRKPDAAPAPAAAAGTSSALQEAQKRREAQRGVGEVKDIMAQNAVKLAERGEKLNEMALRTAELENNSRDFAATVHALTAKLQKKAWYEV